MDDLPPTIAVCRGEGEACKGFSLQLGATVRFLCDPSGETAALYGASAFPTAVVVDGSRKIRGYSHPKALDDLKRTFGESLEKLGEGITVSELSVTSSNPG
jgi:hypothetical protein